jgi:hypothetical protein
MNAALGTELFGRDDVAQSCNLGRTDEGGHQLKNTAARGGKLAGAAPALADGYSIRAIHQMGLYII